MIRKFIIFGCLTLIGSLICLDLNAANSNFSSNTKTDNRERRLQEKYEILEENQIDNTDVYAIPYDDSEVEDQEELDQLEGKKFQPETRYRNNNQKNSR